MKNGASESKTNYFFNKETFRILNRQRCLSLEVVACLLTVDGEHHCWPQLNRIVKVKTCDKKQERETRVSIHFKVLSSLHHKLHNRPCLHSVYFFLHRQ